MNDEITVKDIRKAKKTDRIRLISRYLCDKRTFAVLPEAEETRALVAFSDLMNEDIEVDRYGTLRFYPATKGKDSVGLDNAFKFIKNYLGLDMRYPMPVYELWAGYPGLYHDGVGKDEDSLTKWYESIAVQILVHVKEKIVILRAREEREEEKRRKVQVKASKKKELVETRNPVVRNKWIKPGKMDEYYSRRLERIERLYKAEK